MLIRQSTLLAFPLAIAIKSRFCKELPGLVQPTQLIKLDYLVFTMKHLLQATKSMVCKPSVFMNTILYLGEYILQCFILDKLLTWLTGGTRSF